MDVKDIQIQYFPFSPLTHALLENFTIVLSDCLLNTILKRTHFLKLEYIYLKNVYCNFKWKTCITCKKQ